MLLQASIREAEAKGQVRRTRARAGYGGGMFTPRSGDPCRAFRTPMHVRSGR